MQIISEKVSVCKKHGNWEYSDGENIIWRDESSFKLFRGDGKLRENQKKNIFQNALRKQLNGEADEQRRREGGAGIRTLITRKPV